MSPMRTDSTPRRMATTFDLTDAPNTVIGSETAYIVGGLLFVFRWPERGGGLLAAVTDEYEAASLSRADHRDKWSFTLLDSALTSSVEVDAFAHEVVVRYDSATRLSSLLTDTVAQVLSLAGRLPIHGALVCPRPEGPGLLILGDSGQGKSSLTQLAVLMGWSVVSDDLVALRGSVHKETVGTTVRKGLRIAAHLLDRETRRLGRNTRNNVGLHKIRIDPDVLRSGSFLREARIGRIAFLERAGSRSFLPLSQSEALERLMSICSLVLTHSSSREHFQILSGLVRRADAKVARLTQACLSDPLVLEELVS